MDTTTKQTGWMVQVLPVVILYGGMWGFTEATAGFILHLVPRFTGLPPVAGLILFPLGVCFMLAGIRKTGNPAAAFFIAGVAALIKASSVAMGPVTWLFVQNPVVSILLEGSVVWLMAGIFGFGFHSCSLSQSDRAAAPVSGSRGIQAGGKAAGSRPRWQGQPRQGLGTVLGLSYLAALGWRVLFVLAHFGFGIRWGLPAHGTGAVVRFLLLDSLINAILIAGIIEAVLPVKLMSGTKRMLRPVPAAIVLILAVVAEHGLSLV